MLVSGRREGKQVAGKSFGRFVFVFFFRAVCLFVFRSGLCLLCLSSRSSLGPPDGRPRARLKASTPHEVPTTALTRKTLVPTTANQRSTRTEATRRALTLKTVAMRVDCATLEAPYPPIGPSGPFYSSPLTPCHLSSPIASPVQTSILLD